jgi:hypothetical protein
MIWYGSDPFWLKRGRVYLLEGEEESTLYTTRLFLLEH